MMVVEKKSGEITHSRFLNFPDFFTRGEVCVLNNTKVIPARIWGTVGDKTIEFLLLKERQKSIWEVLCRPAKRVRPGDKIQFIRKLKGKVLSEEQEGQRVIQFFTDDLPSILKKTGYAPLPPYIKRKRSDSRLKTMDLKRYQTVFARREGSIAAPTAGLHFTRPILQKIKEKGVILPQITLDVGLATFQPVRVDKVTDHKMLYESYSISKKAAQLINDAKKDSRPIIATGTTTVRALESAFFQGKVQPGNRSTDLFIYPGCRFNVIDKLLTNFHLPQSTLLMLVSAFAGKELIEKAYREAIQKKYRFFSYGDCMLIL